jgi:hypothetical protein
MRLNTLPSKVFELILVYLYANEIKKLSQTCVSINKVVKHSVYTTIERKVKDLSIYKDAEELQRASIYRQFEYLNSSIEFGEQMNGDKIQGVRYKIVCPIDNHIKISRQLNVNVLKELDLFRFQISHFSLKTSLGITHLYYLI